MQGLRAPLSQEDIEFFRELDNLFEDDLKNAPYNGKFAQEEGIIFIDWKGICMLVPEAG